MPEIKIGDRLIGDAHPTRGKSECQDRTIITPEFCDPVVFRVLSGFDFIYNCAYFHGLLVKLGSRLGAEWRRWYGFI